MFCFCFSPQLVLSSLHPVVTLLIYLPMFSPDPPFLSIQKMRFSL